LRRWMDPWEVLGVARGASAATIKSAFRDKARLLHPDVQSTSASAAEAELCVRR
jgi:curved DNA-binding protein CbpA